MAATLGTVTYDVLIRPTGTDAEPQVVGVITVDLDAKVVAVPEAPAPLPSPPSGPQPEPLPEFIDTKKEARDAAAR